MSRESRHILKNYPEMRIKGVFESKQEKTDFKQTTKTKDFFLLPTDAQENCFKRGIKIYIKIKTAPTCFGVITTIIRERNV